MSERNDPAEHDEAGEVRPVSGGDHVVLHHTLRVLLCIALVVYFIAAALFLGLRYGLLPRVDSFRPRIETLVSEKIHSQLTIGKLEPHWSGFQPGIDVTNLVIRDRDGKPALTIPHATATVSWRSLWTLKPILSSLIVDQPDVLVARGADGSLSVAGVTMPNRHTGNDTFSTWLLRQQAIVMRGGTLRWHDARHDAPELALQNIRLAILNDGRTHHFALQAPPDGKVLHGALDFRAQFQHAPLSAIGKPINWTGQAYVSTGPVDLPVLARYVDFPIETFAGQIDNAIWIEFSQGRMNSASGTLSGSNVALRVRPTQPRLDVPVARFAWKVGVTEGDDYTLQLKNMRAELGQPPLEDGTPLTRTLTFETLTSHFRRASIQHGQLFSVAGDRIDLGILAEFSRALPLSGRILNELVRFNPRGQVANYQIEVERAKPDSGEAASEHNAGNAEPIVRYRLKADLQGISVAAQEPPPGLTPLGHPRAGLPGVENLWGTVDADETHGAMAIDTNNVAVTLPGVFDDPRLRFDRLQGHGTWKVMPTAPGEVHKAFAIEVPELRLVNADATAHATANYSNPGHGRGSLDLKAVIDHAQVTRIARYLPTSISEKLRIYLGHGLQAGSSHGAVIEVHGDLTKFPYSRFPTAGVFQITAPFKGGKFDPSPFPPRMMKDGVTPNVWPPLEGINGTFELKQNLMRFDIDRAHYKHVAINKVSGKIDDLGTKASSLVIDGEGHGPLSDMLDYVNASALGGLSKHVGEKLQAQGTAALALKLTIPRTPKPHIAVDGSVGFQNDRLSMNNVPPLSQLYGKVKFTEHAAQVDRLSGQFLGGDIHANGNFQKGGLYALNLNGHIGVDAARGLNLHGPAEQVLTRISGSAPYELSLKGAKGQLPDITANSDLSGLGLDFPAPFNKPVGTPMPLHFTLAPADAAKAASPAPVQAQVAGSSPVPGPALERAELKFGPIAATYLLRYTPHQPPTVVVGSIGVNKPADLPSEGVVAAVDLDTFDADQWRAFVTEMRGKEAAAAAATPASQPPAAPNPTLAQFQPNRFAVHIGTLTLLKRHWESVIIGASRDQGQWQANVASNQVSGHVAWLPGPTKGSPGTLQARLARLVIPSATENDLLGQAMSAPAQNMPSIDLIVNQLIVRDQDVGKLEVDAHNFEEDGVPVWQLDKLDLTNPAATLTATANWRTSTTLGANTDEETPKRTVFDFKLDIKDAGALLDLAGKPHTLKGGSGTLAGKMVWRGGPTHIDYPTLNGNLTVDLRHGQILKVSPGVAKLLGVISLQSFERVATLDFRDVIGEGLPFESVTGTGQISDGIGRTDNFKMVTAPARAEMKGSLDLAQRTEDLHLHIVPTVSAGAGVVAAAVINPLIGLAALAADFALSQSISHAFAIDYAITGPWAKPHIERVHGDRGKMDLPASEADAQ
ncbi:YhdP family protein [Paraburkholderia sp. DHOC27]|uniref:YhdP family phospholipid transporter n=1 Tax=Paraburkholderia sp. DHOC27 TaxID=2303330 RepID=UPI000E3E5212|nr:AsmA-like C-terminal region-containing protein [Paraburkholderia sp. DHOC27]RFU45875.1 DUF3971 domain-containing protein [Paraburkholderia sp. DHOC27]